MKKYDFDALKREWLTSDLSINQFREKKGISMGHFYRKVDADDWNEARKNIDRKAIEKIEEKAASQIARKWERYSKLSDEIASQAEKMFEDTKTDGVVTQPIEPTYLRAIAQSVEVALRNDRLVHGEPTEIVKADNSSIHVQIVNILKVINGQPNGHPTERT